MNGRETLNNLNKSIESLEKTAGHDIHSDKWKRCVEHVKEQGDVDNAYAVCTASLGDDAMKSFAKSSELTPEDLAKIDMTLLKTQTDKLFSLLKTQEEDAGEAATGEEDAEPEELGKNYWSADPSKNIIVTPTVDRLWGQSPMPSPLDITQGIDVLEKFRERF